jgi:trk system potassium uptake protein TrkA
MKVIICGAGQVGAPIARRLAAENVDVTVIDKSPQLISHIRDSIDVRGLVGLASLPNVLEAAGAEDADMIIAVTQADEVNMIACQVAHSLFNVPTKIARVRDQNYLRPIWADLFSRNHMPIDFIISPEVEVARAVARRLQVPGAFDMIPLADDKVRVIGVRCLSDCPILNTPLRQLTGIFPDLKIVIVSIVRGDEAIVPSSEEQLQAGDEVYFVAETGHLARAMTAFGHDEAEARRVVVIGGGNIGLLIAQRIETEFPGVSAKLIEIDKKRAELITESLENTVVLNGDALDPEILEEVNVGAAETLIAVTNEDEVNVFASLLAKQAGCGRTITLVNGATYNTLVTGLGIDVVVNPIAITVSTILQHLRRGRIRAVHSLREGVGEIIEAVALETSGLVGTAIKEIKLPSGALFGAIVRDGEVIVPRGSTVINTNDRVILFARLQAVKKVEKLFSVRLEFF